MENSEIARIFEEIAELLEIKGENPFRVRSYRNAAVVVEGWPESFRTLLEKGEENLKGIHGIGDSTREKIIEMLTTGKCAFHDKLLKDLPPGILDVLRISGVGPKKAALLYKERGIGSVDELEAAARAGSLHDLPGLGEKTEQNIVKSIEGFHEVSGRFTLPSALAWAYAYVEHLKKVPGIKDIVPAGSLRRWKDSIGDIDILVTCSKPGPVMDAFAAYPEVREVVEKGTTRSAVILKTGIRVDLRVVDRRELGSAMQYFTGSQAHNIAIRDRAKRMGLKVSEYGVFVEKGEKGEKWVAGKTEEDVYRALGLPWIPPELRENRGEIEAALEGNLPTELKVADIRGDLHAHTTESDGGNTLEEMAEAAMARGYEYLAVTDHSRAVAVAGGLDEKRLAAQIRAIEAFNEKLAKRNKKFRVLRGTEVDIRADGSLDHPEKILKKLDCVVAAVHSGFGMAGEQMTGRIVKAIRTGLVNVIAHPTGRIVGSRAPYEVDLDVVMEEAGKYGVALELNSYPERLDLDDVHLRLARDRGVMVAISTDSHSTTHLANIEYGVHTARRGWLERKDVLNTRPLKELMKFLGNKGK
ncbi:MAG: DNA polymerase/3'-5' exonuclease PolX [Thermodesulfobacteriota bacterium]